MTYTLATGAGSQTINVNCEHDLSRARAVILDIELTAADTDAGDTLNIRFQESLNGGTTWNTRARSIQFLGTLSPSASAPETYRLVMAADPPLITTDAAYEPGGSAGATEILAEAVVNGPFARINRPAAGSPPGTTARNPAHRINIAVVDADSDGNFAGTLRLLVDTPQGAW